MVDTTHDNHALHSQDDAPRHGATPLLWLLLVLALVAFGWWYFANRSAGTPGYETTPIGSAQQAAAESGSGTAATSRPSRTAAVTRPAGGGSSAIRAPANRDAALLAHAQPVYPVDERRQGVEGSLTLRIAIDANGVPTDIGYASRSGYNALDRAALTAARDWRFRPAMRNGQAVPSIVNVPVNFRL